MIRLVKPNRRPDRDRRLIRRPIDVYLASLRKFNPRITAIYTAEALIIHLRVFFVPWCDNEYEMDS